MIHRTNFLYVLKVSLMLAFFKFLFLAPVLGQLADNFSDGNLSANPTWTGDTVNFAVTNDSSLQLFAPESAGTSFIATPSSAIEDATWSFRVSMDFNPSSANYTDIYLTADQEFPDEANGYFVRIGDTDDEVSLYRQDGNRSNQTKIIDGEDDIVDQSFVDIITKVTRDKNGNWSLLTKYPANDNFTELGTIFDNHYLSSTYFGIYCDYTKTRSRKFYFDDIDVRGLAKSDTIGATVDSMAVVDDQNLKLYFSEPVAMDEEKPTDHFFDQCSMLAPVDVTAEQDSVIELGFDQSFPYNQDCVLSISNLEDRSGNPMDTTITFNYVPPYQPGPYELLITEIMPDQSPNRELPEQEYFEIYNPNEFELEVLDLQLVMSTKSRVIERFHIDPGEHIIFCPSNAEAEFESYGKTVGLSNWPTLLNRGDTIQLINMHGEKIFAFAYDKTWYKSMDKENGGWSLEMIDTDYPCSGSSNWKASTHSDGGTPGKMNAASADNPDLHGPSIEQAIVLNSQRLLLKFSEALDKTTILEQNISISPETRIDSIKASPPFYQNLALYLSDTMQQNQPYKVILSGIRDCNGNLVDANEIDVVLPETADSLDIIFNELLFDPNPGGVDFIELYNTSDKYIDLENWSIVNNLDSNALDAESIAETALIIAPHKYLLLTENVKDIKLNYPGGNADVYIETNIPKMNNDEGKLQLLNADQNPIDEIYYNESYHLSILKDTEGVSLERINSKGVSDNTNLWQSAAEVAGWATPGLPNSQLTEIEHGKDDISVTPGVFAPNNDGYRDYTSINYKFDAPSYIATLEIYDLSGSHVKSLAQNTTLLQEGFFKWDGTNEYGEKVRIGQYIILFEAISPEGERKQFKEKVAVAAKF